MQKIIFISCMMAIVRLGAMDQKKQNAEGFLNKAEQQEFLSLNIAIEQSKTRVAEQDKRLLLKKLKTLQRLKQELKEQELLVAQHKKELEALKIHEQKYRALDQQLNTINALIEEDQKEQESKNENPDFMQIFRSILPTWLTKEKKD